MSQGTDYHTHDIRYVRRLLDAALVQLAGAEDGLLDISVAHAHIGSALQNTYEAVRDSGDYSRFSQRVETIAGHCRDTLISLQAAASEDVALTKALGLVAESLRLSRDIRPVITAEAPEIPPADGPARASQARPTLQRPQRAAVPAAIPIQDLNVPPMQAAEGAAIPTLPSTMEEVDRLIADALALQEALDSDSAPGEPEDSEETPIGVGPSPEEVLFGSAIAPSERLRAQAHELFGDLGMMGRMRMPEPDHSWLHGDETERRLVARVDALVACGTWVVQEFVQSLSDSPIPDPINLWALLYYLGSLDGQDSADQIFRLLECAPFDDEFMGEDIQRYVANALALAPHPGLAPRLRPWLEDYRLARRRVATEVLSQKRALSLAELYELAQDDDETIAVLATKGIGLLPAQVARGTHNRILQDTRSPVIRAAISSGLRHLDGSALQRAIEILGTDEAAEIDAARFVAMSATEAQGHAAFTPHASPLRRIDIADALGWFGDLRYVGPLIDALESDEPGLPMAAVGALERLTGSRLTAEDTDPLYAEDDLPFSRVWAPPIVLPDPCLDAEIWRAWWQKHGGRADLSRRYRYGHIWCLEDCFWGLRDEITTIAEREFIHLELVSRTGVNAPLEPHKFALPQLGSLAVMQETAASLSDERTPGSWPSRLQN